MATANETQSNLRKAMKEALRIQHRFIADPLFAKTGQGYLKSEGIAPLQNIKTRNQRQGVSKSK